MATVAEFQGRDADQKIGEWKAHTFGLILTVDLPDAKSDHHRDRMNGQGRKQFMDELPPLFLSLRCVGTGRTVGQFDQCDDKRWRCRYFRLCGRWRRASAVRSAPAARQ